MYRLRSLFFTISFCFFAIVVALPVQAQTSSQQWPQRPVRFIIPLGPGSGVDITARLVADKLSAKWGQPVVVENRPGGDAFLAITAVLSAHDDHVLLFAPASTFTAHTLLHDKLPYEHTHRAWRPDGLECFFGQGARGENQGRARQTKLCIGHRRERSAFCGVAEDGEARYGQGAVQGHGASHQ